ncbi:MAG TPA: hypothetical protein PL188_03645 [Candidatus Cloacimonadota bacterium]|nr:hypothetical protein [Candidatus Cloacimonadota bacterium]
MSRSKTFATIKESEGAGMRKYIFTAILLLVLLSLNAELIEGSPIRFNVLESHNYKLDLTLSTALNRLMIAAEFSIDRSQLATVDYYSFFLNNIATVDYVFLGDRLVRYQKATNLHPKHFVPELPVPELVDSCTVVSCYSFGTPLFKGLPDTVSVYVEYWLPLPDWQINDEGREYISFSTCDFWYPRNLYQPSELDIKLTTTIFHEIADMTDYTDRGYVRTIRKQYIDIPGISRELTIFKS